MWKVSYGLGSSSAYFNVVVDLDEVTAGQGGLGEGGHDHLLRPLHLLPRLHRRALHLRYGPQVVGGLLGLVAHFLDVGGGRGGAWGHKGVSIKCHQTRI